VGVAIQGNYAWVAYTTGADVLGIADRTRPVLLGTFDEPGIAWRVAASGWYGYVSDGPAGMFILRMGTPSLWADFEGDDDVDLADFGSFQACFNGPNRVPKAPDCTGADFDGDADVDLKDFHVFQRCFNGANRPARCE
jgi:hypothetical protein